MASKKIRTSDLWQRLREAELLNSELLDTIRRRTANGPVSLSSLKDGLVGPDKLTEFQFQQVIHGRRLRLGPYILREQLGRGGMGTVYRGWHPLLNRDAALKVLRQDVWSAADNSGSSIGRRFEREIEILARLRHPRIVQAWDAGRDDDEVYLAMEFVDGVDLGYRVQHDGPLEPRLACLFATQILDALQYAHDQGLVHRDVKPSNVMSVGEDIKLLDLGLAGFYLEAVDQTRLTESGGVLGTPDFLAPEQARGAGQAGPLSDQYGVGATLYLLLTGEPPFPGGSVVEKILKHQSQPPSPPGRLRRDLPAGLDEVVLRLLEKDPEKRYSNAKSAASALLPFTTRSDATSKAATRQRRAHKQVLGRTKKVRRADAPRRPRLISAGIWPILIAAGLIAAVIVIAAVLPSGQSEGNGASPSSSGDAIEGAAAGVRPDATESQPGSNRDLSAVDRIGAAESPYLVDAAFLSGTGKRQTVAVAWADWSNPQLPGSVVVVDVFAGSIISAMPTSGPVRSLALSPDQRTLAAAGGDYNSDADGTIWLWNLQDPGQPKLTQNLPGHDRGTALVLWMGQDQLLTFRNNQAESNTPLVRIWNPENGELLDEPIAGDFGCAAATLLDENQSLLIAQYPGQVSLWDTASWIRTWQSSVPHAIIYDFCTVPDTSLVLLAAGNNDGSAAAIYVLDSDAQTIHQVSSLPSDPTDLWLMDEIGSIGWVNGAGERVRGRLSLEGGVSLSDVSATPTGPGWYWFEKQHTPGGPIIAGGSGLHLLVDFAGQSKQLISVAAP